MKQILFCNFAKTNIKDTEPGRTRNSIVIEVFQQKIVNQILLPRLVDCIQMTKIALQIYKI